MGMFVLRARVFGQEQRLLSTAARRGREGFEGRFGGVELESAKARSVDGAGWMVGQPGLDTNGFY